MSETPETVTVTQLTHAEETYSSRLSQETATSNMLSCATLQVFFRRWKASQNATRVVLLLVTPFRKMPKALLIRSGKLRNLAYTFVTSVPPGLPS